MKAFKTINFPISSAFAESHLSVGILYFIYLKIFSNFSCDFFFGPLLVVEECAV